MSPLIYAMFATTCNSRLTVYSQMVFCTPHKIEETPGSSTGNIMRAATECLIKPRISSSSLRRAKLSRRYADAMALNANPSLLAQSVSNQSSETPALGFRKGLGVVAKIFERVGIVRSPREEVLKIDD